MKASTQFRSELNLESEKFIFDCGWSESKERIIKLLEDQLGNTRPVERNSIGVYDGLSHAIELIKGETE